MISSYKMLLMYRYIYLMGAFLEPAWGLYLMFFNPNSQDSFTLRIICGLFALTAGLLSFKENFFKKNFRTITNIMLLVFVSQRYLLLNINPLDWNYIIDLYTIVILAMITTSTKKDMYIFFPIIIVPSLFFPSYDYAATMHLITIVPLVSALKWVFFDIVSKYEEAKDKLEEQSVLLGARNLMAVMTHNINNHLEKINLSNEILKEMPSEKLNIQIEEDINEIKNIFNNFSKNNISKEEFKVINLKSILNQIDFIKIQNQIDLNLNVNVKKNDLLIAIKHVVNNAKYEIEKTGGDATMKISADENSVYIKVVDTANTLDPKENEKIFKPFYTNKNINDGFGLGLSITKDLMLNMNGEVFVSGNYPTEFTLKIRRA